MTSPKAEYNPLRAIAATGAPEVLRSAAGIVETRGWTQGVLIDREGRVDIAGALWLASGTPISHLRTLNSLGLPLIDHAIQLSRPALFAAVEYLEGVVGDVGLSEWNDTPGRTQAEVVELLGASGTMLSFSR